MSQMMSFVADWPSISEEIWEMKYRLRDDSGTPVDKTFADTIRRVANAAAVAEKPEVRSRWANVFFDAMAEREFIPGGRILAGAGTQRRVTLFNCFVLGRIEDDLGSIFDAVKEAALTMQAGGGIGHDFSTLRPRGAAISSIGSDASGPIIFMDIWDAMCRSIMSAGARRGAMMATLRCDHPDIEEFIDAKRDPSRLRNFNLSVLVTDAFVDAVRAGGSWDLVFNGKIYRTVDARALWERLMRATYDVAEPGVIFIDRVNAQNNLAYCETIAATNPCGEQPLPPYGACLLGSVNLAQLVKAPFTPHAQIDLDRLRQLTAVAIRFLDDIIDVSHYPLEAQRREAFAKRRVGLGVTGLADALIMLNIRYGSKAACALVRQWLGAMKLQSYETSAALAEEKGAFPVCNREALIKRPGVSDLPDTLKSTISQSGLRNGLLTTIAPTGTTSLLAANVSSGIEPVFDFTYDRKVTARNGVRRVEAVEDFSYRLYRQKFGQAAVLPPAFVAVADLTPADHLAMQAAAQPFIDSAISKTINCPSNITFADFQSIYLDAHRMGLKGCTTYRPNAVTGSVLSRHDVVPEAGKKQEQGFHDGASASPNLLSPASEDGFTACPNCGEIAFAGHGGCGGCRNCGHSQCD